MHYVKHCQTSNVRISIGPFHVQLSSYRITRYADWAFSCLLHRAETCFRARPSCKLGHMTNTRNQQTAQRTPSPTLRYDLLGPKPSLFNLDLGTATLQEIQNKSGISLRAERRILGFFWSWRKCVHIYIQDVHECPASIASGRLQRKHGGAF